MFRFAQHDNAGAYKKNREGNKFSSRVEVRVVTPKKFEAVNYSVGLSASFSSLFFSLLVFSLLPLTNSPLSIRNARGIVKSWE